MGFPLCRADVNVFAHKQKGVDNKMIPFFVISEFISEGVLKIDKYLSK